MQFIIIIIVIIVVLQQKQTSHVDVSASAVARRLCRRTTAWTELQEKNGGASNHRERAETVVTIFFKYKK